MMRLFVFLVLIASSVSAIAAEVCFVNLTPTDVRIEWFNEAVTINNGGQAATCKTINEDSVCHYAHYFAEPSNINNTVAIQNNVDTPVVAFSGEGRTTVSMCREGGPKSNEVAVLNGVGDSSHLGLFDGEKLGAIYLNPIVEGGDGVYRFIFVLDSPEYRNPCQGESNCTMTYAGAWGTSASCPNNTFAFAACGSGSNADCNGHPVGAGCRVYENITKSKEYTDPRQFTGGWGEMVTCPAKMAVTEICGSGGNADCNGDASWIKCGTPVGDFELLSETRTVGKRDWGSGFVKCADDEIMVGFCGSGGNKDCQGDVAQIQCQKIIYPECDDGWCAD